MFKVMTWNVENLFKPGGSSGPSTPAAYDAKIHGLAQAINDQAPDALALQEIGDPAALDDLVALLTGVWHQRVSKFPDDVHHPIRVAWLSPRAITDPQDIHDFPPDLAPVQVADDGSTINAMGRGAVAITVEGDSGTKIRLVTTHLKSKLLTFPGGRFSPKDEDERARFGAYALYRRAAEVATLRVFVSAALDNKGDQRPLILTGDLNDTVQAATTQVLLGPPGSEIGTGGFNQPDKGDAQRLWDLSPLMPAGKDYSRITSGRKELIDHIMVSAAAVNPLASVTSEAIIDAPLASIDPADPNARRNAPSSDHAPLVATFANL
jgi:endonuclease/exonuclease/phosphatase family metal-dependent hydrolase